MIHPPASPNETTSLFLFSFCAVGRDVWVSGGTVTTHCKEGKASAAHTSRRETLMGPFFSTYDGLIALLLLLHFIFLIYPYFRGTLGRRNGEEEEGAQLQKKEEDTTDTEENEPEIENVMDIFANFLKIFPAEKEEIEECISCIRQEADKIDKTHKDCTIASITASSAGATSGILTILGLALAPVTVGGTLILTATGIGLGAAAGITGISASISEGIINSQKNKEAQEVINKCEKKLSMLMSQIDCNPTSHTNNNYIQENIQPLVLGVTQEVPNLVKAVKDITANVKALQCAKGSAALKALAKQAAAKGGAARAALKGVEQVEEAFKGTALAMSKGARVLGVTFTAAFLLFDAYSIAKDAINLQQGAKTETASEIRNRASELEETLNKLNKLYEDLRETMMRTGVKLKSCDF